MDLVYLAGPISGSRYQEITKWREIAKDVLARDGIKALSPMRGMEHYAKLNGPVPPANHELYRIHPASTGRAVMTRDRFDATRCTVLLANLLGATQVSVGTVMEIAWADIKRIPIIVVMEKEGNPHEHEMIAEAVGYRVETLNEALDIVKLIIDPPTSRVDVVDSNTHGIDSLIIKTVRDASRRRHI